MPLLRAMCLFSLAASTLSCGERNLVGGVKLTEPAGPTISREGSDALLESWLAGDLESRGLLLRANRRDHAWLEEAMFRGLQTQVLLAEKCEGPIRDFVWKYGRSSASRLLGLARHVARDGLEARSVLLEQSARLASLSPGTLEFLVDLSRGDQEQAAREARDALEDAGWQGDASPFAPGSVAVAFDYLTTVRQTPPDETELKLGSRMERERAQALIRMSIEGLRYPADSFPGKADLEENWGRVYIRDGAAIEARLIAGLGARFPELMADVLRESSLVEDYENVLHHSLRWTRRTRKAMYPLCVDVILGEGVLVRDRELSRKVVSVLLGPLYRKMERSHREVEAWALIDWEDWAVRDPSAVASCLASLRRLLPEIAASSSLDSVEQLREALSLEYFFNAERGAFFVTGG